ncbi:hypothetical protein MPER_03373 [Moniliophthora perniciosa FA553]|nr:hypothetical protein MPER_03373 [Moniliophthora perniciosa FA553]
MFHLVAGSWIGESDFYDSTLLGKMAVILWEAGMTLGIISLMLRVEPEDELMKKQFGEEWQVWARRVPYKLIPAVPL